MGLYEELLNNYDAKLIAGGAAQNTARGAQVSIHKLPPPPPFPTPFFLSKTQTPRDLIQHTYQTPFFLSLGKNSTSSPLPPSSSSVASAQTNTPTSCAKLAPKPVSASNTASTHPPRPVAAASYLQTITAPCAPI